MVPEEDVMFKWLPIFLLISGLLIPGALFGTQTQLKNRRFARLLRPDIMVESIKVSSEPWQGGKARHVKVEYVLFNDSSVHTNCCPTEAGKKAWKQKPHNNLLFEIRVFARKLPNGRYYKLANGGSVGTHMKSKERGTYHATEVVPVGQKRQYKVIADFGNWINEKNEKNNQKTIIWPTRLKKVFKRIK